MSKFMTIYALTMICIGVLGASALYSADFSTLAFYHGFSEGVRFLISIIFFAVVVYSFGGGCIALISGINAITGRAVVITLYTIFIIAGHMLLSPQHALVFFILCNSLTGLYYVFVNLWKNNPYILWYDRIISFLISLIFGAVGVVVFALFTED